MLVKNTFNFSFFLLGFLLVKFNIILLNEETLILLVFSIFCILSVFRLRASVSQYFLTQVETIKTNLLSSNLKLKDSFLNKQQTINVSANWVEEFLKLKIHLHLFNNLIFNNLIKVYQLKILDQVEKKFLFSKRLEQQFSKLVSLVLLEKINKILKIKKFCSETLLLKKFSIIEKIYLREYLKKIY